MKYGVCKYCGCPFERWLSFSPPVCSCCPDGFSSRDFLYIPELRRWVCRVGKDRFLVVFRQIVDGRELSVRECYSSGHWGFYDLRGVICR